MNQGRKLVELCDRWWDGVSESHGDLAHVAREFVGVLGWDDAEWIDIDPALIARATGADGSRLDFAFLPPGYLEPSSKVSGAGLDYAPIARMVTGACRERGTRFVLVTDLGRSYLYDTEHDELLLYADSPQLFLREIFDEVTRECVDEGGLFEVRRPSRSAMARQLREWEQRWIEKLAADDDEGPGTAEQFMDQLVIARFLCENGLRTNGATQTLECLRDLISGPVTDNAGTRWSKICQALYTKHGMAFFQPSGRMLKLTSDNAAMTTLFGELGRMSKSKFEMPCVLESFNFGEAAEKARVRLVPGPDEEREKALASQSLDTLGEFKLEIDVLEEGYRAIGHWFAELVGIYRRLGVPMKTVTPGGREETRDAITRAVEEGLRIYFASPRQLRTARLLLHLFVIDLYRKYGAALSRFPDIGRAFEARPTLLGKEKDWIYNPPKDHALGE